MASQLVLLEAGTGDPAAAQRRLDVLAQVELLAMSDEALELAQSLVDDGILPLNAVNDALHLATAVTNGVEYLLTWNCRHLANATLRRDIEQHCRSRGYEPVLICTPEELLEEE